LAFLTLFSFDVFVPGATLGQAIAGFFIHNIPVFALLAVLLIAWRHELVGAIAFILAGILYVAQMVINALNGPFHLYMISYSLIIAGPAFLIGILFAVNWRLKRRSMIG